MRNQVADPARVAPAERNVLASVPLDSALEVRSRPRPIVGGEACGVQHPGIGAPRWFHPSSFVN